MTRIRSIIRIVSILPLREPQFWFNVGAVAVVCMPLIDPSLTIVSFQPNRTGALLILPLGNIAIMVAKRAVYLWVIRKYGAA